MADIVGIPGSDAIRERHELSTRKLLCPDDRDDRPFDPRGLPEGMPPGFAERQPVEIIHVDFDSIRRSGGTPIAQEHLSTAVLFGRLLDRIATALRDRPQAPFHGGPIGQHRLSLDAADIVEVQIDRQSPRFTKAEIDRRSALERQSSGKQWMPRDIAGDLPQSNHLLQSLSAKARLGGEIAQPS